jgi:hypothetical protein
MCSAHPKLAPQHPAKKSGGPLRDSGGLRPTPAIDGAGMTGPNRSFTSCHSRGRSLSWGRPSIRPDGLNNKKPGARPGFPFCAVKSLCYFRSSSWPVHEPTTRLILPRSTAPLLEVAKLPSTCFSI